MRGQVFAGTFGYHGLTLGGSGEAETTTKGVGADRLQRGDERRCARVDLQRRGQERLGGGEKTDEREQRESEAGFHDGF